MWQKRLLTHLEVTKTSFVCHKDSVYYRATLKWKCGNKTETTNERKWSDLIGLSKGYKRAWLLVGLVNTLVKKRNAWELSRNQPILQLHVILQNDWSIEQCLLNIRVFLGGKTKNPCFDLFIHWLIKQITNTYRNHFSNSYENRSTTLKAITNQSPVYMEKSCPG